MMRSLILTLTAFLCGALLAQTTTRPAPQARSKETTRERVFWLRNDDMEPVTFTVCSSGVGWWREDRLTVDCGCAYELTYSNLFDDIGVSISSQYTWATPTQTPCSYPVPCDPPMTLAQRCDFDGDGDVDQNDMAVMASCYNGPNRPPACKE
jgi:hypothetical protein